MRQRAKRDTPPVPLQASASDPVPAAEKQPVAALSETPTKTADPRIVTEIVEARGPGGLRFKAQTQPGSVINVISGFAATVLVAAGSALATAGVCQMAAISGAWLAGTGLGTFAVVGGLGLFLVLRYSVRPVHPGRRASKRSVRGRR
ncbi:hypothetical protein GCM10020000_00390 [Streptomyces olivoverticillatus]